MTLLAWLFLAAFLFSLALLFLATVGNQDLADELGRARAKGAELALKLNRSEADNLELRRQVLLSLAQINPPETVNVQLLDPATLTRARPRRPFIVGTDKGARS